MPELLEFEEPVGVLLKEIEALSMLPTTPERERSIDALRRRADSIRAEIYTSLTPWQRVLVARHPNRPNTLDYVERLFTNFDELHGDRRFADDHAIVAGIAALQGRARRRPRPPEGTRHQAEDLPQLRLRAPRRLSKGPARAADGAEVLAPGRRVHRHAGGLSRHGVGGARRRGSHRAQPARDDDDRSADHRHRLRRRGQRRRAGHRDRRSRDDAGVRRLQRDSAGGMRRDPVARREQESRGRGRPQDHRARSGGAWP